MIDVVSISSLLKIIIRLPIAWRARLTLMPASRSGIKGARNIWPGPLAPVALVGYGRQGSRAMPIAILHEMQRMNNPAGIGRPILGHRQIGSAKNEGGF
jgi:hypothetical protein